MAFLLRFGGVNQHVTFASTISIPANNGDSFSYVFDIDYNGNSNEVLFANPGSFNDRLIIVSSTSVLFRSGGSNTTFTLTTALSTGRQVIKIRKDGFNVAVYDGSNNALSAVQSRAMSNEIFGFGADNQGNRFSGDLYSAQVYSDFNETTLVHDYQPTLSGGTGTTLDDDTAAANDGTLNNFTGTTNSWWVSYGSATYSITLAAGSYSYVGNDLALKASRKLLFDSASYDYTGNAKDLLVGRKIVFGAGNYAYSGSDVGLSANRKLTFDAGSYTYSGSDLNTKANRKLLFQAGSYAYTGQPLTLIYTSAGGPTYTIALDAGSYSYVGDDIVLAANRAILLEAGNYNYTGQAAILAASRKLSFDLGSYALTGNDVSLLAARKISFDTGVYNYVGNPMALVFSGQIASLGIYSVKYADDAIKAAYSIDAVKINYSN